MKSSFNVRELDRERQVAPFNIRSEGKLKHRRTNRRDVSGRLKGILDTLAPRVCDRNNLPDVSIISISFMYLFSSQGSVDNNSYPSLMTIRG